jgi:hypothetical protein
MTAASLNIAALSRRTWRIGEAAHVIDEATSAAVTPEIAGGLEAIHADEELDVAVERLRKFAST